MNRTRMRTRTICGAALLALCVAAPPAGASPEWSVSTYTPVVGIQGAGDPIDQMQAVDGVFMDVTAKRVDRKRKVVYKTTFGENVPEHPVQSLRWIGRTSENTCSLRFSAYHWKRKRYVSYIVDPQPITVGTAGISVVVQNSGNPEAFVNAEGSVRAKVTCSGGQPYTLRTDRFYFYAGP